jgi:hypothetical protein
LIDPWNAPPDLRPLATVRRELYSDDESRTSDEGGPMRQSERRLILDQAILMIQNLYAHLPHKIAMYGINPLQRLRLLESRLAYMCDAEFHYGLMRALDSLRDDHTTYVLPVRYRMTALLGILVERYWNTDVNPPVQRWMVSKVRSDLMNTIPRGAVITHWNGVPIDVAVERNGELEAGGNPAARRASGLATLTQRCLALSPLPDEDWVDVNYRVNGSEHSVRLEWMVTADLMGLQLPDTGDGDASTGRRLAGSLRNEAARTHASRSFRLTPHENELDTGWPDNMRAWLEPARVDDRVMGYLRIYSFYMDGARVQEFLDAVRAVLGQMPETGLILDVRANPGGNFEAAEGVLSLLNGSIDPQPMQFISTRTTHDLCGKVRDLLAWRSSIGESLGTGGQYSSAFPRSSPEVVNQAQAYGGPVVLVTDARSYSATDMLAAGFQDHRIGSILGVDTHTGAGGANMWTLDNLRHDWSAGPFRQLPGDARLHVALLRSLRTRSRAGSPLEDLGVEPDSLHRTTRRDLIDGNGDLIDRAARIIADGVGLPTGCPRQSQ